MDSRSSLEWREPNLDEYDVAAMSAANRGGGNRDRKHSLVIEKGGLVFGSMINENRISFDAQRDYFGIR